MQREVPPDPALNPARRPLAIGGLSAAKAGTVLTTSNVSTSNAPNIFFHRRFPCDTLIT